MPGYAGTGRNRRRHGAFPLPSEAFVRPCKAEPRVAQTAAPTLAAGLSEGL
jgi:hypothetical protein